jgi:hypothetical protein
MTTPKKPRGLVSKARPEEDSFHNQDIFEGTGAVYVVSEHYRQPDVFSGDFLIDALHDTHPNQLRAVRSEQDRCGESVKRLPRNALRHQVVVVFGADVTPDQAIKTLERTIKAIKEDGLFAGQDSSGTIVWERPSTSSSSRRA